MPYSWSSTHEPIDNKKNNKERLGIVFLMNLFRIYIPHIESICGHYFQNFQPNKKAYNDLGNEEYAYA